MDQPQGPSLKSFLISPPVRKEMDEQDVNHPWPIPVIIVLLDSGDKPESGVEHSKQSAKAFLREKGYDVRESDFYLFSSLRPADIADLATHKEWIYRIWKDETTHSHLLDSTQAIKAPACWRTFDALGKGITWAVLDTGIKSDHPHLVNAVDLTLSRNFSNSHDLEDKNGHGTHVAGIIAGIAKPKTDGKAYKAATFVEDEDEPQVIELGGLPKWGSSVSNSG